MNQIAKREPSAVVDIDWNDKKRVAFIKEKYAPNSTDLEFEEFISIAQMSDANPILKEIYFIKFGGANPQASVVHSINWMIRKAHESGIFRGFTLPWYRGKNGVWFEGAFEPGPETGQVPTHCKIGVIRADHPEPLWGIISWQERAKKYGEWNNQPLHMMSIRAQAEGLRRTIPGLSTYYIKEEFYQDEPPEWVHEDRNPTVEEVSNNVKQKREFKSGIIDPGKEPVGGNTMNKLRLQLHALGFTDGKAMKLKVNAILDDHGLPEVKKTSDLSEANAQTVLAALMQEVDALAPEVDDQMSLI